MKTSNWRQLDGTLSYAESFIALAYFALSAFLFPDVLQGVAVDFL